LNKGISFDSDKLVGMDHGSPIEVGTRRFTVVRADRALLPETLKGAPQSITPKDIAQMVFNIAARPGDSILELGGGRGAVTLSLLEAVGPEGKVTTYEWNPAHVPELERNVSLSWNHSRWTLIHEDAYKPTSTPSGIHGVVTDLPEPWNALEWLSTSLIGGARICSFFPTFNQIETFRGHVDAHENFQWLGATECIMRELDVKPGATRPSFARLGHSGFLTLVRKDG